LASTGAPRVHILINTPPSTVVTSWFVIVVVMGILVADWGADLITAVSLASTAANWVGDAFDGQLLDY